MATSKEIQAEKRRRRLRTLFILLAAVGTYSAFRAYQRRTWERALAGSLPRTLDVRSRRQEDFLIASCGKIPPLPGLSEVAAPAPADLVQKLGSLRGEFASGAGLSGGAFKTRLLDAPTYYVTEYEHRAGALGAWSFLRHMPDLRGSVLLFFSANSPREAGAIGKHPAREALETFDRAVFFDSPTAPDGSCPPGAKAAVAGRLAAEAFLQMEAESGGPSRFVTIRSEGEEAALWAALLLDREGQVEILPPAPDEKAQDRMALLLLLGPERQIAIAPSALAPAVVERLRAGLDEIGRAGLLEVRP